MPTALAPQALKDIRLVIFDLDGTLIDSKLDLVSSVNVMREKMGLERLSDAVIASYVGQGVGALIRRALANGSSGEVTEETLEKGLEFFLDYYWLHKLDRTVVYEGVREALDRLSDRKLAVLTNKPIVFSRAILAGLGLAPCFPWVYGGNSFAKKKPDPIGILQLMVDTGASPRQTMIVGDSDTDIITGRNAGVWTCGVTYGLAPRTLETSPPDFLVDDLRELVPLLDGGVPARKRKAKAEASDPSDSRKPPTRQSNRRSKSKIKL